jgi:signal transduction histidine kinase
MTQQLMSFGGTSAMRTASISASSETSRTVSLMEPELPENISVRLSFAEDLPPIEADAAQLQQAILNLLTNARDAMPTGGDITISTWLEGEMIGIGIEDEGEGFSDIALSRLFDETVFTNKALFTTKALGHGLGLPATKVMAEAHGGSKTV